VAVEVGSVVRHGAVEMSVRLWKYIHLTRSSL